MRGIATSHNEKVNAYVSKRGGRRFREQKLPPANERGMYELGLVKHLACGTSGGMIMAEGPSSSHSPILLICFLVGYFSLLSLFLPIPDGIIKQNKLVTRNLVHNRVVGGGHERHQMGGDTPQKGATHAQRQRVPPLLRASGNLSINPQSHWFSCAGCASLQSPSSSSLSSAVA